ncbi:MAG: ABC transporter ATP-binding protein/permease [bacterium]|nr:ABC transporter ATP-binding protein/permease [bacterium]
MHPFKRILLLGKDQWRLLPLAGVAAVLFVVSNTAAMWVAASFFKLIFEPSQPAPQADLQSWSDLNGFLKMLTDQLIGGGDAFDKLVRVCLFILGLYTLAGGFRFLQERTLALLEQRLAQRIRKRLFEHFLKQGLGYFHRRKSGEMMSLLVSDAQTLNQNMTKVFGIFLRDPATVIISFILLAAISIKLLLLTLLVGPVAGVIISAVGKSLKRKSTRLQKAMEELTVLLSERLNGILLIKTSGTEKSENKRFAGINDLVYQRTFKQRQLDILGVPATEVIGMFIIITILMVGGYDVIHSGGIDSEDFLRFIVILFTMLAPARSIANGWASFSIVSASGARIFAELDTDESLPEPVTPKPIPESIEPIAFDQVRFQYDKSLPNVLEDLSLTVQPNETLALVGLSGAGKSTLFSLLLRLYDPQAGRITLGNTDVREFDYEQYRRQFGVVTQETILFHDTVSANIAYGYDEATTEEIVAAAKLAYADTFIRELDHGYDTIVGDRGVRLSGGQRQRLSLARAFVRKPKYILLDEATSNLDSDSELLIQRALDNMKNLQTIIIIAHRLSTIRNADRIAVIDNGRVVDVGTYEELLQHSELFARLSKQQFLS